MLKSQTSSLNTLGIAFVCYHPVALVDPTNMCLIAKQERQLYTLKLATDTTATLLPTCNTPSAPPNLLPVPHASSVGPVRNQRSSTQARMRTGPMTPALKARILRNISSNTSKANVTQATIPPNDTGFVTPVDAGFVAPTESNFAASIGSTQLSHSALIDDPSDHHQQLPPSSDYSVDDISDNLSFTSSFPDPFNIAMDDSQPSATGPWMIIDHFTGEMIVDEELPSTAPTIASTLFDTTIQVQTILNVPTLVQAAPPTLLFEDKDERPDWLVWSTNEFLQHVPYYMCLGKVVDLFFTQEARLGYPEKVKYVTSFRILVH